MKARYQTGVYFIILVLIFECYTMYYAMIDHAYKIEKQKILDRVSSVVEQSNYHLRSKTFVHINDTFLVHVDHTEVFFETVLPALRDKLSYRAGAAALMYGAYYVKHLLL